MNQSKQNKMEVTARELATGNVVIFRWNEDLTACDYTTGGIEPNEVDDLLDRMMLCGTHEGNDYKGWNVTID